MTSIKQKLPLLAGGVAGVLVPLGLIAAFVAWSGDDEPEAPIATVPVPALHEELATVTPPPAPAPPPAVTPEPEPEVDPYEPELTTGPIRVERLVLATGVSRHEPTGADDVFTLGAQDRLYAFVEAVNESGDPIALEVTFEPPHGETAGFIDLDVPARARRFRTWAYTRHVYETGRWHAVVRAPSGRVIARRAFDVER